MFFRDVSRPIPEVYNLLVAMLWRHPDMVDLDKAKVVHYCVAGSKPWKYTGKEENMDRADIRMLVKRWRDIYNDRALDFNCDSTSTSDGGLADQGQRLMTTVPEVVVHRRSASSAA